MVSAIIPIYKVEKYIEKCAISLFEQTLKDIEYIFVDDCSPDDSIQVLRNVIKKYPERQKQIRIVSQERNKGLPAARNTGLDYSTGEYVFHCDSDDYVEKDMLEQMYNTAKVKDADIVWSDWFLSFDKNERYMKQPKYDTADEALKGILIGTMKYNVWNKLVKKSLYNENNIKFPSGHGMGEDMIMIRLFACAKRVAYIPKAFYHYVRLNENAFTKITSEKHLQDILYNTNKTVNFLLRRNGNALNKEIICFKLNVKLPFLICDNWSVYKIWRSLFPETNAYIMRIKYIPFKSRILQYAAYKNQFWLVWLYYKIIYKFVYGVIYK